DQIVVVDRFLKKADRTGSQRSFLEFFRIPAGDDEYRDVLGFIEPAQPIHDQKTIPGHTAAVGHVGRKADIEQDEVRLFTPDNANCSTAVRGSQNIVAATLQLH